MYFILINILFGMQNMRYNLSNLLNSYVSVKLLTRQFKLGNLNASPNYIKMCLKNKFYTCEIYDGSSERWVWNMCDIKCIWKRASVSFHVLTLKYNLMPIYMITSILLKMWSDFYNVKRNLSKRILVKWNCFYGFTSLNLFSTLVYHRCYTITRTKTWIVWNSQYSLINRHECAFITCSKSIFL